MKRFAGKVNAYSISSMQQRNSWLAQETILIYRDIWVPDSILSIRQWLKIFGQIPLMARESECLHILSQEKKFPRNMDTRENIVQALHARKQGRNQINIIDSGRTKV
jgi:hypothetical protein